MLKRCAGLYFLLSTSCSPGKGLIPGQAFINFKDSGKYGLQYQHLCNIVEKIYTSPRSIWSQLPSNLVSAHQVWVPLRLALYGGWSARLDPAVKADEGRLATFGTKQSKESKNFSLIDYSIENERLFDNFSLFNN